MNKRNLLLILLIISVVANMALTIYLLTGKPASRPASAHSSCQREYREVLEAEYMLEAADPNDRAAIIGARTNLNNAWNHYEQCWASYWAEVAF